MLQELLSFFRNHPDQRFQSAAIAQHLQLSPTMAEQLLYTLAQRGRIMLVEECDTCESCLLKRACGGPVSQTQQHSYILFTEPQR